MFHPYNVFCCRNIHVHSYYSLSKSLGTDLGTEMCYLCSNIPKICQFFCFIFAKLLQTKKRFVFVIYCFSMLYIGERNTGIEPASQAWEARALTDVLIPQMEPIPGLEPGTYALRMRCSTN